MESEITAMLGKLALSILIIVSTIALTIAPFAWIFEAVTRRVRLWDTQDPGEN